MQMAREYQSAASLIHKELSADLRSGGVARLGRGAEQHSPALLKQAGIALPLWPIARLAEVQEPERAGRQAGGPGQAQVAVSCPYRSHRKLANDKRQCGPGLRELLHARHAARRIAGLR
jgi:hypothetical protein